jgi:hypothetical protein
VKRNQDIRQLLSKLAERETTEAVPKNNFYKELDKLGLIKHEDFTQAQSSFCTDEIYKMLKIPCVETVEVLHSYNETYYRTKGSNLMPDDSADPFGTLFAFE